MSDLLKTLIKGRKRYAAAPSHAPVHDVPEPGKVCAVTCFPAGDQEIAAINRIQNLIPATGLVQFNAEHTTEKVLALFDRAILIEQLREAKRIYENAPSHAPYGSFPEHGTHCPVTAVYATPLPHTAAIEALCDVAGLAPERTPEGYVSYGPLMEWNAEHTTEETLDLFDRAIQAAQHG